MYTGGCWVLVNAVQRHTHTPTRPYLGALYDKSAAVGHSFSPFDLSAPQTLMRVKYCASRIHAVAPPRLRTCGVQIRYRAYDYSRSFALDLKSLRLPDSALQLMSMH
jgi:hypothetical protein